MRFIWRSDGKSWVFVDALTPKGLSVFAMPEVDEAQPRQLVKPKPLPPGTYGVSDSWGGRIELWRVVKGAA